MTNTNQPTPEKIMLDKILAEIEKMNENKKKFIKAIDDFITDNEDNENK